MYTKAEFDEHIHGNDLEVILKRAAEGIGLSVTAQDKYTRTFSVENGTYVNSYSGTDMRLWWGIIPMAYLPNILKRKEEHSFVIMTGIHALFNFASKDTIESYLEKVHEKFKELKEKREAFVAKVS
ncbi:hypothetical protein HYX15_01780 [Candidatus Woesearchaeota archaeon]|nr:hypothetical protein [Candidatus Woesearchaeota archaeon]